MDFIMVGGGYVGLSATTPPCRTAQTDRQTQTPTTTNKKVIKK